jgi:hypothetical protein
MNFLRKAALAGVGLAFIFGLTASSSYGQYRTRTYRVYQTYGGGYYQPEAYRYNSYRRYNGYNRYSGISWRERRRLAWQRYRLMRARQQYFRTRARILNRSMYGNGYYGRRTYYRNY